MLSDQKRTLCSVPEGWTSKRDRAGDLGRCWHRPWSLLSGHQAAWLDRGPTFLTKSLHLRPGWGSTLHSRWRSRDASR